MQSVWGSFPSYTGSFLSRLPTLGIMYEWLYIRLSSYRLERGLSWFAKLDLSLPHIVCKVLELTSQHGSSRQSNRVITGCTYPDWCSGFLLKDTVSRNVELSSVTLSMAELHSSQQCVQLVPVDPMTHA